MRILVAGGGTGGHFYPALAVIEALAGEEQDLELAYVGTRRGIEARVLPSYPWIRFFPIHARGLVRGDPLRTLAALFLVPVSLVETLAVLVRFRPRVVLGMGGYASFAAVLIGALLGRFLPLRTLIHEQNVVPGLANRLLARVADRVLLSYPESSRYLRTSAPLVVTGNPIRREFLLAQRTDALYRKFRLAPGRRTVLVFGGSQGSAALTSAVLRGKKAIRENEGIQVLLVTGNAAEEQSIVQELEEAGVENVAVARYIERMGEAFALADLVVSRAGATTLAEITSCGKPALLVPWGGSADGHQWENARYLKDKEACALANETDIAELGLARLIEQILQDGEALTRMARNSKRLGRPQATRSILGEIHTMSRAREA